MRMMLVHLTGNLRGRTQWLDTESITFGSDKDCAIVFDPSADRTVCPIHVELSVRNHTPVLMDKSGKNALLVNGERKEEVLQDGDVTQLGEEGPERPHCGRWIAGLAEGGVLSQPLSIESGGPGHTGDGVAATDIGCSVLILR